MTKITRCSWCEKDDLYRDYHDTEWGVEVHDDQLLFEMLNLEGAQAGLSWYTVLKKREGYRLLFDNFDAHKIVGYGEEKINELVGDARIIRHRGKIESVVSNAHAFLRIQKEHGSFDAFIWSFTAGKATDNEPNTLKDVPVKTELSDKMSKALKKEGFKFVGSTICYAFIQAIGMVNDHVMDCHVRIAE